MALELIVMVGDNDAGAFGTYTQAGQNYALLAASIIGAAAVSLSSAYAVGDLLSFKHSLHRKPADAPLFYAVYLVLIAVAAAIVLIPGAPLGLLADAVQVLAGVLLPSATVFLLLLSNDAAVLGLWVTSARVNVFTGILIAVLIALSIVLTASILFATFGTIQIVWTLGIGCGAALGAGVWIGVAHPREQVATPMLVEEKLAWRMPPLVTLPPAKLSALNVLALAVLRIYLIGTVVLVIDKVTLIAMHRA